MTPTRALLLASTVLTGGIAMVPGRHATAAPVQPEIVAQAAPSNPAEDAKHRGEKKPPAHPSAPKPPTPPAQHAPQVHAPQPPHPPAARAPEPSHPPAQVTQPPAKHAPQVQAPQPPHTPAARIPQRSHQPAPTHQPAIAQPPNEKRGPAVPEKHAAPEMPGKPGAIQRSQSNGPATPPSVAPHEQARPAPTAPAATPHNAAAPPGGAAQPSSTAVRRAPPPKGNPAAVPPPTQALGRGQFMAPKGQAPTAGIAAVRAERHEVREGNQTIIREPDRTIVQEGNRTFIRHNEDDRFAVGARNVQVEQRGNQRMIVVWRPNGVQIIDFDDDEGRLIRRVRRDPDGREIVLIDNGLAGPRGQTMFLDLPPPVIHIPQDRYVVDAGRADAAAIYGVLAALPVERIAQPYSLDQVRYNEPLRALMPRLDLEINFDTGSWQLTPDEVARLSVIAAGLNRAVAHNPREVFLIEGYTDAVGSDIDNLSLSDRRAEAVAVALTEQFGVPPENLVTQGYGKQFLKVQTDAPEAANRRVAVRRITPLIDPQAIGLR